MGHYNIHFKLAELYNRGAVSKNPLTPRGDSSDNMRFVKDNKREPAILRQMTRFAQG